GFGLIPNPRLWGRTPTDARASRTSPALQFVHSGSVPSRPPPGGALGPPPRPRAGPHTALSPSHVPSRGRRRSPAGPPRSRHGPPEPTETEPPRAGAPAQRIDEAHTERQGRPTAAHHRAADRRGPPAQGA